MSTLFRTFLCGAVALLLLAGCQQTAHRPAPPLQAQLDHIALMLAAGISCAWTAGAATCRTT